MFIVKSNKPLKLRGGQSKVWCGNAVVEFSRKGHSWVGTFLRSERSQGIPAAYERMKTQNRQDYTLRRQINEKPGDVPGCPEKTKHTQRKQKLDKTTFSQQGPPKYWSFRKSMWGQRQVHGPRYDLNLALTEIWRLIGHQVVAFDEM